MIEISQSEIEDIFKCHQKGMTNTEIILALSGRYDLNAMKVSRRLDILGVTPNKKGRGLPHSSGDIYGKVVLTGKAYITHGKHRRKIVECICECKKIFWTRLSGLAEGKIKTCGCSIRTIEGASQHPSYGSYRMMKRRCTDPKENEYKNYGGRGILICEEWLLFPQLFVEWAINNGWRKGLSIERIDNEGNYEPNNCRWATSKEQSRNKRNSFFINAFGETKCLSDWELDERSVVKKHAISDRIKKLNISPEMAMTEKRIIKCKI